MASSLDGVVMRLNYLMGQQARLAQVHGVCPRSLSSLRVRQGSVWRAPATLEQAETGHKTSVWSFRHRL